jgi:hypothetical protein
MAAVVECMAEVHACVDVAAQVDCTHVLGIQGRNSRSDEWHHPAF